MRPKTLLDDDTGRSAATVGMTLIGPELVVVGDLTGEIELIIKGRVLGSINAHFVVIGEGAHVDAVIIADRLVVHGRYFGSATALVVKVGAKGQISGSITHNEMAVDKGAVVGGLMPWRPISFFEQGAHEYELCRNDKTEGSK